MKNLLFPILFLPIILFAQCDPVDGCINGEGVYKWESGDRFEGMLTVKAEITSMCSHHHQPVKGVAIIGVIPTGEVIGLSKYVRVAQWCARRGQLQEELCNQIAREIQKATDTENVAVYIEATHGCMEHRGVMAHSSLTQTTVVHGLFHNDAVKSEFFNNVKNQMRHC